MAKTQNNPFVIYGYKGNEYFCDRTAETEKIISALDNERNVTLIAPRRIGKTGLIHHVFSKIRQQQPDVVCIYFDILSTKTLEHFVQLMARNILGRLDTPSQNVLRKVQEFFSSFRPTMTFDSITGVPTFSLDFASNQVAQSLQRIFEYIAQSGRRCYIAIDEFQQITKYEDTDTEALLRSFIQFVPNAYFIFSGSYQHLMSEMFLSPERPFYQGAQIVSLKEIDAAVYHEFADTLFRAYDMSISKEVFDYLYDRVDGQTWYVQATLNRVFSHHYDEITVQCIDEAIRELINEEEIAFENYYAGLTINQSKLLTAIACEGGVVSPMSQVFVTKYRLPALSSIKLALKTLMENQFVYSSNGKYIVYDRFFGIWLRERA
ncbi:MAG: ATP-binding protein [Prevotella sp.]|nr:ATP-binding protein [Prevotella sp.]